MGMILNMSITGSVVIVFVLFARLVLKKAPKVFSYALWAVVLFRLLCPVTITTEISLLGLFDAPTVENTQHTTAVEYVPYDIVHTQDLEVQLPVPPAINEAVNEVLPQKHAALGADSLEGDFAIGSMVWVLGMGVMLIYSAVSYIQLRSKLIGTVLLRDNIYLADSIGTPFVMGIIRPKIYLPSVLSEQEQGYIIFHEQHHIRRGDHIIKLLAFLALCIHWFNPLVWVAFALSSKDMEMSCDEAVVKKLGESIRTDYSASLLSLATGRRIIAGTPLAFGEGDTKSRIKNMLKWKKAKPAVIFLSAVAVILAVIVCGTNAAKNHSWIKVTPGRTSVELDCNFETPIHSYAIYEDVYENGELISSEAILFDSFQEEGGATPRQTTMMLNAQPVNDEEGGFAGELALYSETVGTAHMTRELPKERYTGIVHIAAEIGTGVFNRQKIAAEDSLTLLTVLLSTDPHGKVVVDPKGQTLMESNDTVVRYRLVTSEEGIEQYFQQSDADISDMAEDLSYYLELAADTEFQDMDMAQKIGIMVEYEDLLDDYTLIARKSTDGKASYIIGCFNGNPAQSPLYEMYGIELSAGEEEVFQFLYREEHAETVEAVLAENKTDIPLSAGYRIEDSRILWSSNGETVLIQPKDAELLMDVPFNRILHTPNGREYIVDAVSRGIDVCGKTDTCLYVYRMSEQFGEIAERIALTEAEAAAILTEEPVNITDGFGFCATLHMDGQTTYYSEHSGIPQTVLDLAVEKCDYRFEAPGMIADTILEARLDCDWLENPLYAKGDDITRLREILKNAEFGYVGGCGYGAKLSLRFADGEKMTVFKGCDSCDTIVFGSYGGYFLGDKENTEFWEIFGLDPENKLPYAAISYMLEGRQEETAIDGNQAKVEKILSSAKQNLREGYEPVSLTYVDNSKVSWDYYDDEPWETEEQRDALAQAAMQELYTLTGYQVEECVYTTDGRSRFIFGKSEEYIRKSIAFYSRDYGFTLAGNQVPWQGFVNARRAHYSDVQQLDSPYHKKEYSGHGAIPAWFLERSGVYRGEKIIGFDAINLDDTVYTHIKLNFDGGYYLVVMDEKIESVHEVSGPYVE